MKNYDIQRKLLTETVPPQKALILALMNEKEISDLLRMSNDFYTSYLVHNKFENNQQILNKREKTLVEDR